MTQQLFYKYALANVGILIMLLLISCSGDNGNGNTPPTISLISINKDVMIAGNGPEDQIIATLEFEDIDGDIEGIKDDLIPSNIFIRQVRDGGDIETVSFPDFPNLSEGQKGTMDLTILTTCCLGPNGCAFPKIDSTNVFPYEIHIVDSRGNMSNIVTTPPITLICN